MRDPPQAAQPSRSRPQQHDHPERHRANDDAGGGRGAGTDGAAPGIADARQQSIGKVAESFAADDIGRLHGERVQRPEAFFGEPQQRPAGKPAGRQDRQQQQRRPEFAEQADRLGPRDAEPDRHQQWRRSEQQAREADQQHPGDRQLGEADLRQQAARQREQRTPLGARRVVLDVAVARIDDRRHPSPPAWRGRSKRFGRRSPEQRGEPAARRMLLADGEHRDQDRHADEGAGQAPQEGPEEHREQHHEGRNG